MLKIIFYAFGESGGEVDGVCNFCLSVASVFITSCGDANGPLNGIFLSIGDRIAVRDALKISIRQIIVSVGAFAVKSHDSQNVHIQIMIRFKENSAKFIMFDDGERLHFHGKNEPDKVLVEKFESIKKIAKSCKYQYVLNMNYITFEF